MDCRQFLEEISNFMDGDVSAGIREAVEEHLALCHECQVVYHSTKRTLEIVSHCRGTYELPQDVSLRLYARLRSRLKQVP